MRRALSGFIEVLLILSITVALSGMVAVWLLDESAAEPHCTAYAQLTPLGDDDVFASVIITNDGGTGLSFTEGPPGPVMPGESIRADYTASLPFNVIAASDGGPIFCEVRE